MNTSFKKIMSVILSIVMLATMCSFSIQANDLKVTYAVAADGMSAVVVSCAQNETGDVVISPTVDIAGRSYDVTSIGKEAFMNCNLMRSVTIPEGVLTIGDRAFVGCDSLVTVNVPKSLTSASFTAFEGCEGITINCYDSNYSFFAIYALSSNMTINVLDDNVGDQVTSIFDTIADYLQTIIEIIEKIFGISFGDLNTNFDFNLDA